MFKKSNGTSASSSNSSMDSSSVATPTTSSVEVLHYGANERRAIMLQKLGGKEVLNEAIDKFYNRQMADPELSKFFKHSDIQILKWHQLNFMSIVFSSVPENFNIERLLLKTHTKLFEEDGLDEYTFDVVIYHFRSTLQEMNVDETLIAEAIDYIMPVRAIFAKGAKQARERLKAKQRNETFKMIAIGTICVLGIYHLISGSGGSKSSTSSKTTK